MNFKPLLVISALIVFSAAAFAGSFQDNTTGNGRQIGNANDKLAFHGATPVVQRSGAAQAAVTNAPVTVLSLAGVDGSTNSVACLSSNQCANVVKLLNELRAALVEKGLIKGE